MEWIAIAGLVIGIAGLVIGLIALRLVFGQMYLSCSRYKELKINQDRIVDYLHRAFDKRIEADTKFDAPEMTATVGVRRKKKPVARFNLLRWLYLKVKDR